MILPESFAIFSDGGSCTIGWGACARSATPGENSFYINDFQLEAEPWLHFANTERFPLDSAALHAYLRELPCGTEWDLENSKSFTEKFQRARAIPELRKILLTVNDRALTQKPLSHIPPAGEHFFYAFSLVENGVRQGAWGLSPELLYKFDAASGCLHTMALAGTFSGESESRHEPEHRAVVEFLKHLAMANSLHYREGAREVSRFSSLKHFRTPITFTGVRDFDPDFWIRQIHPTPALGIAPRTANNLKILQTFRADLPPHFGAPFGLHTRAESVFIVMIRGQFFAGDRLARPVGVGVTPASTVEAEWEEINLKRRAMDELWRE